jgi:two-component system, NarL family, sensor histidine kinase UhpB
VNVIFSVMNQQLPSQTALASILAEREAQFRATFEHPAIGCCHVAPDGRWLRVNEKLCEIVGYSREDLLQKTFQDITHPDDLAEDLAYVEQ